ELLTLSVLGPDIAASLQELTVRVARAFVADNCMLFLQQEAACYTAQPVSDDVVSDLAPLCETVCELAATVVAPPRRGYRAFLGVPIALPNAPALALLLVCREQPTPF